MVFDVKSSVLADQFLSTLGDIPWQMRRCNVELTQNRLRRTVPATVFTVLSTVFRHSVLWFSSIYLAGIIVRKSYK